MDVREHASVADEQTGAMSSARGPSSDEHESLGAQIQSLRDGFEAKLRQELIELEQQVVEKRTLNGMVLDDLRLEEIRLRSTARRMEGESLHVELFKEIERDIALADGQIERGQKAKIDSLCTLLDELEKSMPSIGGTVRVTRRALLGGSINCADLRAKRSELLKERRADSIRAVTLDQTGENLRALSQQQSSEARQLENERLRRAALEARFNIASGNVQRLSEERDALLAEHRAVADEVEDLRVYTGGVQARRQRQAVLDRFVTKHAASRNPRYIAERDAPNVTLEKAQKALRSALAELDTIEKAMSTRSRPVKDASDAVDFLVAKIRAEIVDLHTSVFDTLAQEEDTSNALCSYVESNPGV